MVETIQEIKASQETPFLTETRVDKIIHKIDTFFEERKKSKEQGITLRGVCVQGTCSQISAQNLAILCTKNEYNSIEVTKEKMPTTQVTSENFDKIFEKIKYFIFVRSKGKDFNGAVIIDQMPEVLLINDSTPEKVQSFLTKKYEPLI